MASAPQPACTAKAAHPATVTNMARMMGLTTAAKLLGGQPELAEAMGIQPRSLHLMFLDDARPLRLSPVLPFARLPLVVVVVVSILFLFSPSHNTAVICLIITE